MIPYQTNPQFSHPTRLMKILISARHLLLTSLVLLTMTGCTAVRSTQGDVTTYKNSIPHVLGLAAIGVAFLVFGIGIAKESYQKFNSRPSRGKSKSKRPRRPTSSGFPTGVLVGSGLTLIGIIIVVLGLPSALLAYVEVGPDKVVLRDKLFWFSYGPQEIPYSSISDIDHEEVQVLARRGVRKKEYLYITHTAGVERIEMTPIHKAAREQLESTYAAYQQSSLTNGSVADSNIASESTPDMSLQEITDAAFANSTPIPQRTESSRPSVGVTTRGTDENRTSPSQGPRPYSPPNRLSEPEDNQNLTVVDRVGRYTPGIHVMAKDGSGKSYRAEVIEIYQEGQVKVRFEYGELTGSMRTIPVNDAFPAATSNLPRRGEGPGREIASIAELSVGMKVLGQYDARWYPAEVKAIKGSEPTIQWDGERSLNTVPLNWVRLPE